jgi:hypothetical protein
MIALLAPLVLRRQLYAKAAAWRVAAYSQATATPLVPKEARALRSYEARRVEGDI